MGTLQQLLVPALAVMVLVLAPHVAGGSGGASEEVEQDRTRKMQGIVGVPLRRKVIRLEPRSYFYQPRWWSYSYQHVIIHRSLMEASLRKHVLQPPRKLMIEGSGRSVEDEQKKVQDLPDVKAHGYHAAEGRSESNMCRECLRPSASAPAPDDPLVSRKTNTGTTTRHRFLSHVGAGAVSVSVSVTLNSISTAPTTAQPPTPPDHEPRLRRARNTINALIKKLPKWLIALMAMLGALVFGVTCKISCCNKKRIDNTGSDAGPRPETRVNIPA